MAASEPVSTGAAPQTPALPFPLQEHEVLLEVCRRHWIYLWPLMVFQVLVALVPVAVIALVMDAIGELNGIAAQAFTVVAVLWVLFWAVRILLNWYRYRHDIWVITDQRLIDSYRSHPFHLHLSTADLVNVQDMTVLRSGVLQTTLDFGSINCQTASIDQDFKITGIPNPRRVQARIDRERDRARSKTRMD